MFQEDYRHGNVQVTRIGGGEKPTCLLPLIPESLSKNEKPDQRFVLLTRQNKLETS